MSVTTFAVHGAAGRMGKRLVALGAADQALELRAAIEHADHPMLGQDAGEVAGIGRADVPIRSHLEPTVDVVIDFSTPASAEAITTTCREHGIPLVMATTGLSQQQQESLQAAAEAIPVVWAPNMSLAVNLTMNLARSAAAALKDLSGGADVEIIDRHHRYKEDSPSGTALKFGEIIAEQMGQTEQRHGREGILGARPHHEIGFHALRVGDNPGEHTIVFGMLGETVELTVRATNRDCYATGALEAAKFLRGKPAGLYSMNDVLGLSAD